MKPLDLKNNALFLSCWYERSRRVQITCYAILLLSILLLSYLGISSGNARAEKQSLQFFHVLTYMQVGTLLLIGTLFACHMGSRERMSETLDFHRNSPEPVASKIFGIIFGSAWFEWGVFVILFFAQIPFLLLETLQWDRLLLWNVSLALSGIFFHTSAVAITLLTGTKKRGHGLGLILLFIFFGGPFFLFHLVTASSSFFTHLFGLTAFQYLFVDELEVVKGWFYIFKLPLIVMQMIVQIPLFVLMLNGLRRIFRMPNSPAFSKTDLLSFCGFVFFMITGFFMAGYHNFDENLFHKLGYSRSIFTLKDFVQQEVILYVSVFTVVGILISFFNAPTYFKVSKYLVLNRKGMIQNKALDDGATGLYSALCYIGLGVAFFMAYFQRIDCSLARGFLAFLLLSSYILSFAGLLEFFRLSRFRHNKIFLMTVMIVWWVFIPWMAILVNGRHYNEHLLATTLSPFFGLGYVVQLLENKKTVAPMAWIVPCIIPIVMWLLAWKEHAAVRRITKFEKRA